MSYVSMGNYLTSHFSPNPKGNRIRPNRGASSNTKSSWLSPSRKTPKIDPTATIRHAFVLGDVTIGPRVHIVNSTIRADEGTPFYIGEGSNVQDNVLIHGHHTYDGDKVLTENMVSVPGKGDFSVYIGSEVSLAHGAMVHGPVAIGDNSFIGFRSTVDHATVGKNCEIGAHAYINNVTIPDGTGIRAGAIITQESDIAKYSVPLININSGIVKVNNEMALTYRQAGRFTPTGMANR